MKNDSNIAGKTILLVNTGSLRKRFILQRFKKLGLKIVCLNKEKNWAQSYVDHWILADNTNQTESIAAVKEFITNNRDVKIDGVLTFWEDDILLTSKIADKFNFIGVPLNVAKKARNKFLFREFCKENGLPSPKHTIIKSLEDIKNLPEELTFPMVIKPAYGAGSAYVIKVESKEDLANTYKYIKKHISVNIESALSDGLDIFIEEYIEGDEVDIDIVLQNGKIKFFSISDNYKTNEPFFIETGQSIPSTLSVKNKNDLIDMAEETLERLEVQNSIIHFEAKSTQNGPVPIEVNLRMGGDEVYDFVKSAWGVDLIDSAVKIALGIHIPKILKTEVPKMYLTGVNFLSDYSGVLSKIDINPELDKKPYLEELYFFKKIGDPVLSPPEGYDNLGWITVSGHSMPDAQDNLKDALKLVKYEVARFAPQSSIGKTSRKNSFKEAALNPDLLVRAAKIERIKRTTKEDQRNLHIGVACNMYEDEPGSVEQDLTSVGKNIEKTLLERGYKVTFFDFNNLQKAFNELKDSNVDLVFNVCERINDSSLLEPHAAAILDTLEIPYTGSNPFTLSLCIDKIRVKKLLAYHGIPTPKWDYAYNLDDEIDEELKYPLIVKPANTDNSIGITNDSVVTNEEELRKQLKVIVEDIGTPALIEEYIEGDEYDVSIIGSEEDDLRVLPLSRSIFKDMPEGKWHIYTHEIKFSPNTSSSDYGIMIQRPPKNISKKLEALITEISLDTYNILDCHDYGRVEVRVDKDDNPYVLELNPNPSINIDDCVPDAANLIGFDYGDFLEEIIFMAIRRYKNRPSYYHLQTTPL